MQKVLKTLVHNDPYVTLHGKSVSRSVLKSYCKDHVARQIKKHFGLPQSYNVSSQLNRHHIPYKRIKLNPTTNYVYIAGRSYPLPLLKSVAKNHTLVYIASYFKVPIHNMKYTLNNHHIKYIRIDHRFFKSYQSSSSIIHCLETKRDIFQQKANKINTAIQVLKSLK